MNELRKEKLAADIEALQENELFVQAVLTAGSIENIVRVLESYGIESTAEEIRELAREGAAVLSPSGDELGLEDLEAVSGGGKWRGRARLVLSAIGNIALTLAVVPIAPSSVSNKIITEYNLAAGAWTAAGYAKKGR